MKWDKQKAYDLRDRLKTQYSGLQIKMEKEYQAGLEYVSLERSKKRDQKFKLNPLVDQPGKVYVKLIENAMTGWMAINVLDENEVEFTPMGGFTSREVANNANKTAEYDYEAMNMFEINTENKWNTGFYGAGIRIMDGWDDIEKMPLPKSIDPLSVIPDPQNYQGSKLRFFGIDSTLSFGTIKNHPGYFNWAHVKVGETSIEEQLNKQSTDASGNYVTNLYDEDIVGIYNHFIWFEGHLFLSSWANDRQLLVRLELIEPKTSIQKKDISRIRIPVSISRRKVVPGRFFGLSIPDEIEQYQDQATILTNLQMKNARLQAYGPDIVVNAKYIDTKSLQKKEIGGRVLTYKGLTKDIKDPSQVVSHLQHPGIGQFPEFMVQRSRQESELAVGFGSLTGGVSPAGDQTKAEIQTLQKNLNQTLSYSTTLMTKADKEFWELWYESYVYNLSASDKKYIVLTRGGMADSYEFKRKDFVLDEPVLVRVKSKSQESIKKKQKFAMYSTIANTILPNLKQGSHAFNEFIRKLASFGGMEHDDVMIYIPYTDDELRALDGLELLNRGELPITPKEGEDYQTYIEIYSLAKESPAKSEIIGLYMEAYKTRQKPLEQAGVEGGKIDPTTAGQIGNMAVQELSGEGGAPSIADI